jgi:hypothetical protein
MFTGNSWQCPFCAHRQVLSEANLRRISGELATDRNKHSVHRSTVTAIECMNEECRELYLAVEFHEGMMHSGTCYKHIDGRRILSFLLRPNSIAKPQHSSVPAPLVRDYEEACSIVGGSPKAAATLARRCLQGMIRDFCSISKPTLHAEIRELKKQVEAGTAPRQVSDESIEAIDAVRQIGNIGAHFEKEINLIVDVEPEEAAALISLTDLLFQEWYVSRYERQARLGKVKAIADAKREVRNGAELVSKPIKDGVDNTAPGS